VLKRAYYKRFDPALYAITAALHLSWYEPFNEKFTRFPPINLVNIELYSSAALLL